jgi:hypothetical protein
MIAPRACVAAVAALAAVVLAPAGWSAAPRTQTGPVVIQTTHGGFAWGDAAIGAAAALGVLLVVAGVLFLKGDRNAS